MTRKKGLMAISLLLTGFAAGGCAAIESGPLMMRQTAESVEKVIDKALDQIDFTQLTANAGAKISDPRFAVHGYFCTGVVYRMNMDLIGADMEVAVAGAGVGDAARNVEGQPPTNGG